MESTAEPGERQRRRDPADVRLGERIRARRIALQLSLADVGAAAQVTFQQVQKYEAGINRLTPAVLERIAVCLGMTASDLFPQIAITDVDGSDLDRWSELAEAFSRMSLAQRSALLEQARAICRSI